MRVFSIEVPDEATSLASLLEATPRHTGIVGIQAPEDNTETVFIGDKKIQPLELRPMASGTLRITSFGEVYIIGTPGDFLTIILMDGA